MTHDFIPIQLYTPIYYYLLFAVILLTLIHTQVLQIDDRLNLKYIRSTGIAVLLFVILYIGLRPLHGVFTDMKTYASIFDQIQTRNSVVLDYDYLFYLLTYYTAKLGSVKFYFFLCAFLYVFSLYIACKKWFKEYWFYGFLMLIISFSFWNYGTNGIRNGIATSLFIFAISREKRIYQIIWLFLAIGMHKSMLLPTLGFFLTYYFVNNSKYYLRFWLLCIPLSFFAGNFFESIFTFIDLGDDRLSIYLSDENFGALYKKGFRWDFLLYSASGVLAGWYYIFKKNINDKFYSHIFNIYLFANGFWILIIKASFSNRFAYLSWFLLGILIIYPLLKQRIVSNQHQKIGWIILIYFLFSFLMNVIIA